MQTVPQCTGPPTVSPPFGISLKGVNDYYYYKKKKKNNTDSRVIRAFFFSFRGDFVDYFLGHQCFLTSSRTDGRLRCDLVRTRVEYKKNISQHVNNSGQYYARSLLKYVFFNLFQRENARSRQSNNVNNVLAIDFVQYNYCLIAY